MKKTAPADDAQVSRMLSKLSTIYSDRDNRIYELERMLQNEIARRVDILGMIEKAKSLPTLKKMISKTAPVVRAIDNLEVIFEFMQIVAAVCGVHPSVMTETGPGSRPDWKAWPRQLAMYLCCKFKLGSSAKIGASFGKRDHCTVLHACQVVRSILDSNTHDTQQQRTQYQNALRRVEEFMNGRQIAAGGTPEP